MSNDLLGYDIPRIALMIKEEGSGYWDACRKFVSDLDNNIKTETHRALTPKQEDWLEKIETDLAQK